MKTKLILLFFICTGVVKLNAQNPIITHMFTADPALLVYKDTVFLYVGHDTASTTGNSLTVLRLKTSDGNKK